MKILWTLNMSWSYRNCGPLLGGDIGWDRVACWFQRCQWLFIVDTPPPPHPLSEGEIEPPTKFSKRGGGLTGLQLLEGGCWQRGGDFFQGGGGSWLQFSHKNELKSEIFNDKKSL